MAVIFLQNSIMPHTHSTRKNLSVEIAKALIKYCYINFLYIYYSNAVTTI